MTAADDLTDAGNRGGGYGSPDRRLRLHRPPVRRALIGFEVEDLLPDSGYLAVALPVPGGLEFRPAVA